MPVNGFSVGKDVSFTITNPVGALTLNGLTNFTISPAPG